MNQLVVNNYFKKKHIIKVPDDIQVTYCSDKNFITFSTSFKKKSIRVKVKILLVSIKKLIIVTDVPTYLGDKNFEKMQGTTVSQIRQILIELSYKLFTSLVLVGVGYRAFVYENMETQIYLKLGYSHLIYFKIPVNLTVFCQKSTKLFLFGNSSFNLLTQTASQLRSCKLPEVYKGKGILYNKEKIIRKKGKKI